MNTVIALFRGINVGGNRSLPMRDLVAILEEMGARDVRTYIRSGNAVFRSGSRNLSELSEKIRTAIGNSHGFRPEILLLSLEELKEAIASNPFPEGESEPKTLHLNFLVSAPETPNLKKLESFRKENERFRLTDNIFYLYAPDGIGRSRLAANFERALGVPATDRNWRTVLKIVEMAEELE